MHATTAGLVFARPARAAAWLRAAAACWFAVTALGQCAFAYYIAAFYGGAALAGRFERWNDVLAGGHVAGGTFGNGVLAAHLLLAFVLTLGGLVQLVPHVRARAPALHRWNGRVYVAAAVAASLGGLYAVWTRGTAGGDLLRIGISLNGLLIVAAAGMAMRHAIARRIALHRRWALRLFVLVSGVWFFRVGLMLWIVAHGAPVGIGDDFDGPFVRVLAFACYLVPLAVLELYLYAQQRGGAALQAAVASLLALLTVASAAGSTAAALGMWLPRAL